MKHYQTLVMPAQHARVNATASTSKEVLFIGEHKQRSLIGSHIHTKSRPVKAKKGLGLKNPRRIANFLLFLVGGEKEKGGQACALIDTARRGAHLARNRFASFGQKGGG